LIELPDGKIALIDGGDDTKETEYAIMRYLYALDIETIDYLILTHADEDHCGALDTVVENVAVKQAYLPLQSATVNTQYAELYTALLENEIAYVYAHNGVDMSGEGYTFTFLHPFAYDVTNALEANKNFDTASNEYSAVVWLEYNGVGSLFTGDLPASQERVLAQAYSIGAVNAELAKTEILKVGHHGSQNSTSQELLSVIPNLKTAIISCGENAYGHPHEEVLERLTKTDVYRTDEDGSVFISIKKDEQTYSVTTLGK